MLKQKLYNKLKRPIMIKGRSHIYEIPYNYNTNSKVQRKINGLKETSQQNGPLAYFLPSFRSVGPMLIVEKGKTISEIDNSFFIIFLNQLQKYGSECLSLSQLIDMDFVFDHCVFNRIEQNKKTDLILQADSIFLPLSEAHGDLHAGNVVFSILGKPKLIDWEHYHSKGSYLLDLFHLLLRRAGRAQGIGWTEAVKLNDYSNNDYLHLLDAHNISLNQIKFAYIYTRICLEAQKKMAAQSFLKETEVEKFKRVVLYSNSLI